MSNVFELSTISGELKVGNIHYKSGYGYDYDVRNWKETSVTKPNFNFINQLDTLTCWNTDSLYLHYKDLDEPTKYPNYLKFYINNCLVYIGKFTGVKHYNSFEYAPIWSEYSMRKIFSYENIGKSFNIKIEFYDKF